MIVCHDSDSGSHDSDSGLHDSDTIVIVKIGIDSRPYHQHYIVWSSAVAQC